jgi:dienelactone hydrolase
MAVERIEYRSGDVRLRGALVHDERAKGKRPLLLVAPNWIGVSATAIAQAQTLVGDRFVGFVPDMYGDGKTASGPDDAGPLANAVRADTPERRRRIMAGLDAMTAEAEKRGIGDATRRAAVGFCFGGGNVLELARAGADIQAAVSLHGDLVSPLPAKPGDVKAALMVLHGSKDPVAPKAQRDTFEAEMDAAGAKWQLLAFGGLVHSFCEEDADIPGIAQYDAAAARQSFRMVASFIADAFDNRL